MVCRNALLSCASAIALSFAMTQSVLATPVEEASMTAAPAAEVPAPEAPAAEAPAQVAPAEAPPAAEVPAAEAPAAEAPAAEASAAEAPATEVAEAAAPEAAPPEAAAMPAPPPPPMSMMAPPELSPKAQERLEQHRKKMAMSPEERWEARRAELDQRYEDLRARAAEAGVQLPESAPWERGSEWPPQGQMEPKMAEPPTWPAPMGMSDEEMQAHQEAMQQRMEQMQQMHKKMAAMTPKDREAMREQRYQELRERAAANGIELPELPPWKQALGEVPEPPAMPTPPAEPDWAKYEKVISGMSPEEREACMAVHRMHMQPPMSPPPEPMMPPRGYGYGQGQGYGPSEGWPNQGYGPGYGWGRGGGYGPRWGGPQGYQQ